MRRKVVNTSNTARFLAAVQALQHRGADEACLVVVDGEPGLGKTQIIRHWAVQHEACYVRAKREWTPAWMLRELLESLAVVPERTTEQMFRQAVQRLGLHQASALREGRTYALVIDEADHIVGSTRQMETVRDLSDALELPTILVGMGHVRSKLSRLPQIASRVAAYVEMLPASVEDVAAFLAERCEVPVAPCLIELLHQLSRGRYRELLEAIPHIEGAGPDGDGPVTVAHMRGRVLLNDRATGRPIEVPA